MAEFAPEVANEIIALSHRMRVHGIDQVIAGTYVQGINETTVRAWVHECLDNYAPGSTFNIGQLCTIEHFSGLVAQNLITLRS